MQGYSHFAEAVGVLWGGISERSEMAEAVGVVVLYAGGEITLSAAESKIDSLLRWQFAGPWGGNLGIALSHSPDDPEKFLTAALVRIVPGSAPTRLGPEECVAYRTLSELSLETEVKALASAVRNGTLPRNVVVEAGDESWKRFAIPGAKVRRKSISEYFWAGLLR